MKDNPVSSYFKDGRILRTGYTTGSCAAAAAHAAVTALILQKNVNHANITLPDGTEVEFKVSTNTFKNSFAECYVIKDSGDDPDITNGVEVHASAEWQQGDSITVVGGEGVGIVTKPGLPVCVGLHAINPIPMQMIINEIKNVMGGLTFSRGIQVTISVPRGDELAKRTLNGRLGIIGGISILGTTGIVIPYSISAFKTCISQAINVSIACGCHEVVFTTGRRSEKYAQNELKLSQESFVLVGDHIGYALKECVGKPLRRVVIWGMTGKISKLAAGSLYTNISESDIDIGFLMRIAEKCGIPANVLGELSKANNANHLYQLLPLDYKGTFSNEICLLAATNCREEIQSEFEIACIMTDYDGNILGEANV
jgi:cobalt-precorrin-5B (C1)-methyltransferase